VIEKHHSPPGKQPRGPRGRTRLLLSVQPNSDAPTTGLSFRTAMGTRAAALATWRCAPFVGEHQPRRRRGSLLQRTSRASASRMTVDTLATTARHGITNERDRNVTVRGALDNSTPRTAEAQVVQPLESRLHFNKVREPEEPSCRARRRGASRDVAADEGVEFQYARGNIWYARVAKRPRAMLGLDHRRGQASRPRPRRLARRQDRVRRGRSAGWR
jgi:hypothetical protein